MSRISLSAYYLLLFYGLYRLVYLLCLQEYLTDCYYKRLNRLVYSRPVFFLIAPFSFYWPKSAFLTLDIGHENSPDFALPICLEIVFFVEADIRFYHKPFVVFQRADPAEKAPDK